MSRSEHDARSASSNRPATLIVLYAILGAGWLSFALRAVPRSLRDDPDGNLAWLVKRLIAKPGETRPVEFFLTAWREIAWALFLAMLLHLSLAWLILRPRPCPEEKSSRGDGLRGFTKLVMIVLSAAFLTLTVLSGIIQDYFFYLQMWREVWLGHDPWFLVMGVFGTYPLNAYGPLFNLLAPVAQLHSLLPKLLFAYAYLLFVVWLVSRQEQGRAGLLFALAWFWCPFAWIELAYYGHFDVLVGLLCVGAIHARAKNREAASGISLGLGALLKYLPVTLLPFLALDRGKIHPRVLASACLTIAAGFLASVLVWGPSTFQPLFFAATRRSYQLSIFRFLRGPYSPLQWIDDFPNLDGWSSVVLLIALTAAWRWCKRNNVDGSTGCLMAVQTTLLCYQVGFAQYQMALFIVGSYWMLALGRLRRRWLVALTLGLSFLWLSIYNLIQVKTDIGGTSMENWIGLLTFSLGITVLVSIIKVTLDDPHIMKDCSSNPSPRS